MARSLGLVFFRARPSQCNELREEEKEDGFALKAEKERR